MDMVFSTGFLVNISSTNRTAWPCLIFREWFVRLSSTHVSSVCSTQRGHPRSSKTYWSVKTVKTWLGSPAHRPIVWSCLCSSTGGTDRPFVPLKSSCSSTSSPSSSHFPLSRRMNTWQEWVCSQVLPTLSASCSSSSCVSIWSSKWDNSILSGRLSRRNLWKGIRRLKIVSIWRNTRTPSSNLRSGTLKILQTLSNKLKTQNFSRSTRTCWKCTDQTQWTRS